MTRMSNKIRKTNPQETYVLGFNRGFGRALQYSVRYLRDDNFSKETIDQLIAYVLARKEPKKHASLVKVSQGRKLDEV